jgi:hypothetical protein
MERKKERKRGWGGGWVEGRERKGRERKEGKKKRGLISSQFRRSKSMGWSLVRDS